MVSSGTHCTLMSKGLCVALSYSNHWIICPSRTSTFYPKVIPVYWNMALFSGICATVSVQHIEANSVSSGTNICIFFMYRQALFLTLPYLQLWQLMFYHYNLWTENSKQNFILNIWFPVISSSNSLNTSCKMHSLQKIDEDLENRVQKQHRQHLQMCKNNTIN